jgi:hypothetical protein
VTLLNTAPVVSAVSISPSSPTVSDPLICSYTFIDDDTDADASIVTWTVGSATVGTGTTLSAGSAIKGETVFCSVEADDAEDTGNTETASTTIQNSAPTAPVISISPSAPVAKTDDLVCSIDTLSTDADTDTITYTFLWEVEGVSWTGSTSTTTESGDTIDATDLVYDEEWTCVVTPDDGMVAGTAGEDSVTVQCQDVDGEGYADDSCGGTDCDDSDSSLTPEDADGDGYSTCDGDCDDSDANYTLVCSQSSCADILSADSTSVDGIYSLDYGSGPMDLYCDMTGGGVTIENFGFGPHTDTFSGWEFMDHTEFTGFAVSDAMAYFYTTNGGLENLDQGFNSSNCCIVSAGSGSPYYGFAGSTYMYPANSNGTVNCNGTYNDSLIMLTNGSSSVAFSSLTQAQVQNVNTYSSCAISGNPGIFIQRW